MKRAFWFTLGIILVGIAYAGIFLPGIPWSTPTVGAAYCFAKSSPKFHKWLYSHHLFGPFLTNWEEKKVFPKSSPKFHKWLYSHHLFGPFLTNWEEKKVFPTRMKYAMLAVMASSLLILWLSTGNINAIIGSGIFMTLAAIWGWRYPGSVEEHDRRVAEGKRVAWLK